MAADGAVLLVDDVQWADEDTISVLTYLADSVEDCWPSCWRLAPNRCFQTGWNASALLRRFASCRWTGSPPSEVADALRGQQLPDSPRRQLINW